jgi:predicted  nucleic acid-binding Zn-ribbon protein
MRGIDHRKRRGALAADRAVVTGELETLGAARDTTAAAALAAIAELAAERGTVAADVPAELLADYERAAAGSGIGVGTLERGGCTACGNTLPSRVVSDLLAGPTLTRCPECARLLILPD